MTVLLLYVNSRDMFFPVTHGTDIVKDSSQLVLTKSMGGFIISICGLGVHCDEYCILFWELALNITDVYIQSTFIYKSKTN